MNSRRRATWLVFAGCVAIVAVVLVLVTGQGLRLERRELRARAQAEREEAVRLALWRLDSLVTPIIAREAGRPYFHYRSFYPAERAYTRMWQPIGPGDVLVPSPLLDFVAQEREAVSPDAGLILVHFQVEPDGALSSPQAPTGNMLDLAESGFVGADDVIASAALLDELRRLLEGRGERVVSEDEAGVYAELPGRRRDLEAGAALDADTAETREAQEFQARQQAYEIARNSPFNRQAPQTATPQSGRAGGQAEAERAIEPTDGLSDSLVKLEEEDAIGALVAGEAGEDVFVGPFEAAWIAGGQPQLVFARDVVVGDRRVTQGFWVDWAALSALMLSGVRDLLPAASLQPSTAGDDGGAPGAGLLATLPVRLDPGPEPTVGSLGLTPTRATLVFSWLALVAAAVAIGLVLRAAIGLSERRGRFVSAVTHELRTPLTTFRLYAQMLADGMVSDEDARREYLLTLKQESGRLSGIVENVLEYARLSRRRGGPEQVQELTPEALLVRLRPTLSRRAEQSGMDLIVSADLDEATRAGVTLSVDPHAVERILMNLVENACKYAGPGEGEDDEEMDPRIHLDARVHGGRLEMLVADYGPGIAPRDRARVFGEFQRGGWRATRAGLGLGLALSRGLAREAGGDLRLVVRRGHGAEFLLSLPVDDSGVSESAGGAAATAERGGGGYTPAPGEAPARGL